jgi:hypothetical protein
LACFVVAFSGASQQVEFKNTKTLFGGKSMSKMFYKTNKNKSPNISKKSTHPPTWASFFLFFSAPLRKGTDWEWSQFGVVFWKQPHKLFFTPLGP